MQEPIKEIEAEEVRSEDFNRCQHCDIPIIEHRKCKHCEILLHEESHDFKCRCGKQHTKECEFNDEFCEDCFYKKFNSIYK